ncbi:radical SAM protein [Candidatus Poribacteria bacterium]|nr:radical SAM protein [Candidatus Poribacteria bacterium]
MAFAGKKFGIEGILNFLAEHKNIHKLLNKALTGSLGKVVVTALCYAVAKRYGKMGQAELKGLLGRITALRNFSENTPVNIFNEMQQLSPNDDKLKWIVQGFRNLDVGSRARLLRRLFYNIVLRSLNRKITKLRYGKREDFVPNLGALLFAPVDKCNLRCEGCVTASDREECETPSLERMNYVIEQAKRLNVFSVVVIGKGEPFYSQDDKDKLFALAKRHDDLNFAIFTNGTTLQESDAVKIKKLENVYPIVSLDGLRKVNDARRGAGVYERVMSSMNLMNRHGLIFGYCATAYRGNYRHVLSPEFINTIAEAGCKFGLYLRFLPLAKDAQADMILSERDEVEYDILFEKVKAEVSIPLIDFHLFERWHGCRARRGSIIYIDGVTGKVAPCAKTPYAPPECNIYVNPHKNRLLEILRTDFFACYRASYTFVETEFSGKTRFLKQCSLDFVKEIEAYLQTLSMSPEEQEKLRWVQEKLSKAQS